MADRRARGPRRYPLPTEVEQEIAEDVRQYRNSLIRRVDDQTEDFDRWLGYQWGQPGAAPPNPRPDGLD